MLNHLVNEFNKTETLNGALAYKSTKSDVLDLFSMGGAYRNKSDDEVVKLFSKAYAEDATLAMKTLFYLRDITQGQGERRFFRLVLRHLSLHNKDSLVKNLHLIPLYGRWDDMWGLLETPVQKEVVNLVKKQLLADKDSEHPSLLAKWMPSENASSTKTKKYAKILRKVLDVTPRQYRKLLSSLRSKIDLVETKITKGMYADIDYTSIPSKANMVYRKAFSRNDTIRYDSFLKMLSENRVKVNSKTLYPNDIVGKILGSYYWDTPHYTEQEIKLFEGQWNNLPNYIGDKPEDSIVMADVSGSMSGTPMNVAISLAMYIAERNKGAYKDHFMTFSKRPELVKIQGTNIVEKVNNISRADWGMSTNIEKSLQTILDVAVKNNLSNEEVVKKIYIISDMQFNHCVDGANKNIFKNMEGKFNSYGYDLPNIVFWNVNAYSNTPMTMNEAGVQLVSGFSPSILTQLLNSDGKTPYDFMLDVICGDRYQKVTA